MAQDATIISASLSDSELKQSIDNLVKYVEDGTTKMAKSMNDAVAEMKRSLQSLANTKIDMGGTSDGGSSKRTKKQQEEAQAVKETTSELKEQKATYDQVAQAQQMATRKPSTAEESYQTFIKNMRENVALLAMEIKAMPDFTLGKQIQAHEQYERQIEKSKQRIAELRQQMAELGKDPSNNRLAMQQTMEQISAEQQKINTLQKEQILEVQRLSNANKQELAEKQAQYELERKRLVEMSAGENERAKFARNNTEEAQKYTEEIQKQAKAIRESKQWKEDGTYTISRNGTDFFVSANVERKKGITLEEQLLAIQENITLGEKSYADAISNSTEREARLLQKEEERLGIARQITEEKKKRKYVAPESSVDNFTTGSYNRFASSRVGGDLVSYNELTSSTKRLSEALKQQQYIYSTLTAEERNHPYGQATAINIQNLERSLSKLNAQMRSPVSLDAAMGLSEKTLDDIAYKMQMLQRYRSGLDVNAQRSEINQVNQAYDSLKKKMDEVMAKSAQMNTINKALTRSFNYMKNRLAFYFTVGASTSFVKQLIDIRSQYELTERSLGILVNSAERGSRIFNELSQMALVSPYTLIELSNAAKQLTAYGVAAKDVVDTTRRLADISAAVGAPVERIAYALGHVQSYGYLTSLQARQFANNGIPLVKELANRYSELEEKLVTTSDVFERMKKKQVSYADVMGVVNKMTDEGGRFFDFQAKQAETLRVRLSNLNLQIYNMYNDMGKSTGGLLNGAIKLSATMFKNWRSISRVLATVITTIGVYKTAIALATLNTKMFGIAATKSFLAAATGAYGARNAVFLLGKALASIPFAGWAAAIASVLSYFVFFNNSVEESKQKLDEIQSAFRGLRKEVDNLFVNSIKSNNLGTQLSNLKDMLELAESELGVTIPINIEDVNESNVKQKLNEAKQTIENYIGFAQVFSEEAVGSKFNESMNEYGSAARKVYYTITESINATISSLQELSDAGKASERDIKILNELLAGQKEDESKVEYLQRIVKLYEELGLLSEKAYSAKWWSFTGIGDNLDELKDKQGNVLDRLGVKNKEIYSSMLDDVQKYYSSSAIAAYQFELQVARVAKKIDIDKIPIDQRTLKMEVAINQEASQNNWNEFEKEFARQIANTKYGTSIQISSDSKSEAEEELSEWQKRMQDWCNKNKIEIKFDFNEDESEKSYRERMLQAAKDAKEDYLAKKRQSRIGTATKEEEEGAKKAYELARKRAELAGADLSSLDKEKKKKDHLLDALKQEISIVEKLQGDYDKLTKAGATSSDALLAVRSAYGTTIDLLNKDMKKYGLPELNLDIITSQSPKEQLEYFKELKQQLETSGLGTLDRMKAVEGIIEKLDIKVKEYNLDMVTKGLNNELGKLKEEYELAIELDANPELGGVFADMMGLSKEELEKLPRDFEGVVRKLQNVVDKELGMGAFDVRSNLNKEVFDEWVKSNKYAQDSDLVAKLKAITDYANKVRQDETKKQIDDWNKLLEKYAEYEYKRTQITKEAARERAIAQKNGSGSDIMNAIDLRERRELAKLDFEQFQNTPTWIAATGDLASMTSSAIGMLISKLEQYKKSAKNLDPKQIKQINSALKKLYSEQRKGNPFAAIANAIDEAKERFNDYQIQIDAAGERIDILNAKLQTEAGLTEAEKLELAYLIGKTKEWREEQEKVGKVSATAIVEGIQSMLQPINQVTGAIGDMFSAFGDNESSETIKMVTQTLDKAASFAAMGAQIGGAWGAAIGGIIGFFTGLVSSLADVLSGNAAITEAVEAQERVIKRLTNSMKSLEHASDNAYGAMISGAQRAIVENKKLQLANLQRELQLEQSRKEKNKDEDKIIDLQGQIADLRREITDGAQDIVNELLGISSAGDGITQLVDVMIEAFKNGEDAMQAFGDKWDEMIDNMILKLIVSDYMQKEWDKVMKVINEKEDEMTKQAASDKALARYVLDSLEDLTDKEAYKFLKDEKRLKDYLPEYFLTMGAFSIENVTPYIEKLKKDMQALLESSTDELDQSSVDFNKWAIEYMSTTGREHMTDAAEMLSSALGEWFTFGENNEKQLSNLQQGIQGITETTAGAIEAYLNGVSQQVYLHSDLLTEIRDAVIGMNINEQLGVQSEILLQLQNGYQTMLAMKTMMENWQTPAGNGIRVEML